MSWIAAAVVATTAVSAGLQVVGANKAAKSAKKQGDLQAERTELLNQERVRQIGIEERSMYGETLSGYARGGVMANVMSGSPEQVLSEQKREFQKEREITTEVGALEVSQGLERSRDIARQYRYEGYSNAASSISGLFGKI